METSPSQLTAVLKRWIVRLAGPLLVGYVLLLLVVMFKAQSDFREANSAQLRLDLEKRASALSYFYLERYGDLRTLAGDNTLVVYFANEALGMSMEYGLRASLLRMTRTIRDKAEEKHIDRRPVFRRIAFVDTQGRVLADSRREGGPIPAGVGVETGAATAPRIRILTQQEPAQVIIELPYLYKGERKGYLVAFVSHAAAFQHLVYEDRGSAISQVFLFSDGRVLDPVGNPPAELVRHVAGEGAVESGARHLSVGGHALIFAPVANTPMTLVAQYDPAGSVGFLTSNWVTFLLALLSLFILLGVAAANRVRSQNLILHGRMAQSLSHRRELAEQNQRLLEEMHKRQEYEARLSIQANYDNLTKLPNRTLALDRLAQALLQLERHDGFIVVMLLDLDRFKKVNDSLGHAAGDQLLIEASSRLVSAVRETDTVARIGGDEFLVLLTGLHKRENTEIVCNKIIERFSKSFLISNHEFFVTASIGLAIAPDDGADAETLLKNADIALYKAKDEGRNAYRFFTAEMNQLIRQRQEMENQLLHALQKGEFSLMFQPIMRLRDQRVAGAEALLRWHNSKLGWVSPALFVPLAEDMGIIPEIGEWVLREACLLGRGWQALGNFRLSVNVSSVQLRDPRVFLRVVEDTLATTGFPAEGLELEMTETLLLEDSREIKEVLQGLDALGIRLAIDDFGTGYSALSYLKKFSFDTLKIDRSFVSDLPHDEGDVELTRAILAMAHALNLEVNAEGVEERAQAQFLLLHKCDFAQGYYFHRPMQAEQLTALIEEQRALNLELPGLMA